MNLRLSPSIPRLRRGASCAWTYAVLASLMLGSAPLARGRDTLPAGRAAAPAPSYAVELPPLPVPSSDSTALFAATAGTGSAAGARNRPSALCIFCLDYWQVLKDNVKHVFTEPGRWDAQTWRSVGIKALIVAGTMAWLDENARTYVDDHHTPTTNRIANDFMPFGRQYAAYIVGGFLVAGDLAHNDRAKAVAVDGLTTTAIAAGLIVPTLKLIVGRSRPRANQGVHDFHPLSGGYSFPSGHATAAFSVAASVAGHYNQLWVKGLSYGIATMVAYSRMEKDAHYLSDVTAGAMIGIGVAHAVRNYDSGLRHHIAVGPAGSAYGAAGRGISVSLEYAMR